MKKKEIAISIGIIILAILLILYFTIGNKTTSKDSQRFKNEYESLNDTIREKDGKTIRSITIPKNNPIKYSTEKEIIQKINNKETFLIYFGFNDCPWCRSVVPILIETAKELKLTKIYYVDIKTIRDTITLSENGKLETTVKGSDGYYELLDKLKNVLADYTLQDEKGNTIQTNEKRIFAPNIVAVVKGQAVGITEGISEQQTDGYMKLTIQMKNDSKKSFKKIINCVLKSKTTC